MIWGFTARLIRLDKKISAKLIEAIRGEHLDIQIASPGDHHTNLAERAIQTLKLYFISACAGDDPSFPTDCWDLLLKPILLIINLVQPYHINPASSA